MNLSVIRLMIPALFLLISCSSFGPVEVTLNRNVTQSRYKKIAIAEFDVSGYDGQGIDRVSSTALIDRYTAVLIGIGYDVIERQRLEYILKEYSLSMSGLVDPKTAQKIGNLIGVQGIVFGSVSGRPGAFSVMSKLVDTETGSVVWTVVLTNNIERNGAKELKKALDRYYKKGGK